ncbi:hypothetical protein LZL87_002074 [Fusarium oxysporum]|uniref:Uncharacterized protein n=1 Tax=Fusarium oxysporum f. sp. rapae TaxID=485398 RepID=A0A8J5P602_FUSOX|nr:hypothetical protein Forpe1208_v009083 [Fusarium oxysporum f. sp. rapae]KAI7761259.1 hypothetical protein LZL87_002074 [Fusarium oxysporum]
METLETSQCHISLEDLVADDERNELDFDIVNTFDRALNTGDRIPDQGVDQRGPDSSRSRSVTGSNQSTEGQQLDAEAEKLADELEELW